MIHQIYPNKNKERTSQSENHYASSNQSNTNTKQQWHYGQSTINDHNYNDHQFNHHYVNREDNNTSGNNRWTSLLHRFDTLATGSYKYNPFIINRVNRLGENEDNVTDQDFYRLFRKQTFNNEYLNSLQRKSNYFRFEYFNPLNAREYYKNLDEQVLALITGEIGSMPDLKKPSDKHSKESEDEADIHSHKKIIESNDDEKSEAKGKYNFDKVNIVLISSIIIIFLGIIGRYLFKLLKN
nr:SdrH family protein [Staphylococcus petrasii]